MGVDYLTCANCEDNFPDCGPHVSCDCGNRWCDDSCAEGDGFREEPNGFTPKNGTYEQETSCNYCRGEDVDDADLLAAFLHMTKMTREQAVEWYNKVQAKKESENASH
ncbi:hypothetical protein CPT_Stahl71 [Bacillus phage Stahl]|uniref:Uncharacterized protein n=1 Tax=Bacillus phage Stahl TaxID=1610832 RepID=A0A0E3GMP1_9CAUD|nr:hypothetical protein CPT_Stahl71 [Bacillus phage Stahl]AKA61499.1 hypothetical protein CPT_Stahl71 [Bacillus phage Stahl]